MNSLLSISALSVRFPLGRSSYSLLPWQADRYLYALSNLSLDIDAGETVGLIGQSGSGKSTLGRTIMGLESAYSGSVKLQGLELMGLSEKNYRSVRRKLAMIFQDPVASLSPRKTVGQLVAEPFCIHKSEYKNLQQEAVRLLKLVGLDENFLSAYPHQLSGGQARRVGIARALALDPAIIIADEPTAGLDVSVQGEIINLMNRLQEELNIAYLFITHNLSVARHVCDRLAILYAGSLVELGPTDKVLRAPAHPYTELLLRSMPHADPMEKREDMHLNQEEMSYGEPHACVFYQSCTYSSNLCRDEIPAYWAAGPGHASKCHFPLGQSVE
ncbi:MAG: ABC transporter ATP-binding protein [Xanthomonadales bacterium]|nr:ABC transporter ATP-binding protein [Xanthomonadales bacterium]